MSLVMAMLAWPSTSETTCSGVPWASISEAPEWRSSCVRRILRAYSHRVGDGDVEAPGLMLGLAEEIDTAIAEAVKGLRACGYSWAEIGARLGITRQAAQQRWGSQ